jgi:hypothetical protein
MSASIDNFFAPDNCVATAGERALTTRVLLDDPRLNGFSRRRDELIQKKGRRSLSPLEEELVWLTEVEASLNVKSLASYPLRRTQPVTFSFEKNRLVAELCEVNKVLHIRGEGADMVSAFHDLAQHFDRIVREKLRTPPHVPNDKDLEVASAIDHLVNWKQYRLENPLARPLWGKLLRHLGSGKVRVQWLMGPRGIRDRITVPDKAYVLGATAKLRQIPDGQWFCAVVKEHPDRVEWVEQPYVVPDPRDPERHAGFGNLCPSFLPISRMPGRWSRNDGRAAKGILWKSAPTV